MLNDVTPPNHHRLHPKPRRIEPLAHPPKTPIHELAAKEDVSFKTPEQIAEADKQATKPIVGHHRTVAPKKYKKWLPHTGKQQIIFGAIALLIIVGAGTGWALTHHKHTTVATKPVTKKSSPKPKAPVIIYSNLTGLPVTDSSVNQRPVTAVMVENSLDARPQSGLSDAGVVFEAVAEGGVTRFMALYQDTAPTNVGPIRSARPYYVQWAMGFDAAYAHVGGSPDALSDITAWGVHDMNQFYNGAYYHRVSTRAAPHNVYTGIDTLQQLESKKGYTSTYTGFVRGKEAPVAAPTATSMDFRLSGVYYDPHYDYSAATNSYNRSEYNAPQTDANTGKQVSPKVIIAIVVPLARGDLDSSGAYYSNYNVIGSGTAYIFQNGTLTNGTWNKSANNTALTFTDASGQPVPLNPGQTWITAVSAANQVSYK
ncbi:MAG TPA: DUF3048 domain-containing protein [Candidatus Saccharimonadia bacterium]|nr:DUF3048 domain-containing protein [Candidatus Saccharimonadia bacterium]